MLIMWLLNIGDLIMVFRLHTHDQGSQVECPTFDVAFRVSFDVKA